MQPIHHLIGFFCDTPMVGSGYMGMLQIGFMAGCRKWDCSLLIKSFDFQDKDIPERVARVLERTPLSGVILPEPMCDMQEVLDILFAAGVPVVRITPHSPSSQTLDICIDNCQAGYDLTTFLIGLGHKRIAFIRGPSDHYDAEVRFEGFCKAMEDAGLEVLEDLCPIGSFDYASGLISGEKILTLAERPTAIFACNDDIATAVLATAHSMGLKVPQDVSLAGFDDAPIARMVWPPLTTCRQKMELTGYMAIDFLIDPPNASDTRRRPQQHELVIRKSTARPKS
jgi:LacI family transcriptional regulator